MCPMCWRTRVRLGGRDDAPALGGSGQGGPAQSADAASPDAPTARCSRNSDCVQPRVCLLGECHSPCATSADCNGGSCLVASEGVCQTAAEHNTACSGDSNCSPPLVCASGTPAHRTELAPPVAGGQASPPGRKGSIAQHERFNELPRTYWFMRNAQPTSTALGQGRARVAPANRRWRSS